MNEGLYFKADSSLRIIDVWEVKQENRRLKIATRNIQTVTFTALLILGHGYIKKNCRSFFENRGADLLNRCTEILTSLFLFMVHGPGGQGMMSLYAPWHKYSCLGDDWIMTSWPRLVTYTTSPLDTQIRIQTRHVTILNIFIRKNIVVFKIVDLLKIINQDYSLPRLPLIWQKLRHATMI